MDIQSICKAFAEDGFVILKDFMPIALLDRFEATIDTVTRAELDEIGFDHEGLSTVKAMAALEAQDRDRFFKVAAAVGGTYDALRLATHDNLAQLAETVHAEKSTSPLVCSIIGLFWNQRDNKRLQYDWHQESVDYVDFDWSFHGWFPLFDDVPLERGPMEVARASHGKNYPYEMRRKTGSGTQLIPLIDVEKEFETLPLPVSRGDMILFHHALVHRTGVNQTDTPRVSGILRFTPAVTRGQFLPMIKYQYANENHKDKVRENAAVYTEL